ncbi:MAG: CinA family protein [Chloroflexi bacterium]|nr:CinA family protein [Chloroflexota bacterium]
MRHHRTQSCGHFLANGMPQSLEEEIGKLLAQHGLSLAVAESCTGGLLAHRITNISGSSHYFLGGVVSYANEAKEILLGVPPQTLQKHGAVSEEVARAMAQGARRHFGSDLALAITGIAGPTGGTPEKPVGLTHIALATETEIRAEKHIWSGDRLANKSRSVEAALRLLRSYLQELKR